MNGFESMFNSAKADDIEEEDDGEDEERNSDGELIEGDDNDDDVSESLRKFDLGGAI